MIKIKQNQWDLATILPINYIIPPSYFKQIPSGVLQNFCHLLSRDVFSEGDAQFFYNYVMTRKQDFSTEFLLFINFWLTDELKHYEALRRVYHCVSGISFTTMDCRFAQRIPQLEPIKPILKDEFTILIAFMFDEIGSVYSYRRDLWEYYRHFSSPIQKIGHHLIKDEGTHFNNAAELLLSNHQHRLPEIPDILNHIAALERQLTTYYQCFFLDHAQEKFRFPENFNQVIIRFILARLGLGKKPNQQELKKLWQWTPQGCNFVPVTFIN